MTGRQKYAAAMTGTIQGPICFHIALEWLSLCDSGLWGWVVGILCSACWNKVDCWILFHNWIDFVHHSKSGSQLNSSTISKTVSTFDFWQTLSLHLIQILFATFYSFSTFWSGVKHASEISKGISQKNIVKHCSESADPKALRRLAQQTKCFEMKGWFICFCCQALLYAVGIISVLCLRNGKDTNLYFVSSRGSITTHAWRHDSILCVGWWLSTRGVVVVGLQEDRIYHR